MLIIHNFNIAPHFEGSVLSGLQNCVLCNISIELICTNWSDDAGYQVFLVHIDKRIRHFQANLIN